MPIHLSKSYPGFEHDAHELSAFTKTVGIFIIALVNRQVARFEPDNAEDFEQWLKGHHIRDIRIPDDLA